MALMFFLSETRLLFRKFYFEERFTSYRYVPIVFGHNGFPVVSFTPDSKLCLRKAGEEKSKIKWYFQKSFSPTNYPFLERSGFSAV